MFFQVDNFSLLSLHSNFKLMDPAHSVNYIQGYDIVDRCQLLQLNGP